MINKIKNEYLKIGYLKLIISTILLISLTILLYKYNDNLIDYLYIITTFIGLTICILFSGIISNEYDSGTFRFYLTKPNKRYKIFISKYISIVLYLVLILLLISITYSILINKIIYKDLLLILKYSIPLLTMSSIIIMLSTLLKNVSLSTSFSLSIYILSNLISQIFFGFGLTIIEYTFLPYLDFSIFNNLESLNIMNQELNINLTLNRGIIINIISTIIIFITSLVLFNKKDIKS